MRVTTVTADVAHNETSSSSTLDDPSAGVSRPHRQVPASSTTSHDGASPPRRRPIAVSVPIRVSASRRPIRRRSIRKTSVVGSSVVLDCDVPPPPPPTHGDRRPPGGGGGGGGVVGTEYMVKWHKQGVEVPIFIQLDRLPAHVDAHYHGRARLLADDEAASLEVTDVRLTDAGWYECSVVYIGSTDDPAANGTWVYLAVTGQSADCQSGPFRIARSVRLSVTWRSCLGYRHAGCLQLSHRRPPE